MRLIVGLFLSACVSAEDAQLIPEDSTFWSRLLQNDNSLETRPPMQMTSMAPIQPPMLPVAPPVKAPMLPPVTPPVAPPVKVPVPVAPPVKAPMLQPITPPVAPPVKAPIPVAPPVKAPMLQPVTPPVAPPVKAPVPVTPPVSVPQPCDIDVTIDCATSTGLPCSDIQPPNPVCSAGSEIAAVSFGYSANACNPAGNSQGADAFCQDISPIDTSVSVTILCRDASTITTGLVVEPATVSQGGVFIITAPSGSLPAKVDCIVLGPNQTQLQQVVVDTSGDVSLNLKDEFGAFTLLGCGDESSTGGVQSCLEALSYTIDVNNVGPVPMEIEVADFIFDGVTTSFLTDIETNILPGGSIAVQTRQSIDLCASAEYCVEVNVEANPPNGDKCQDTEQYCFQVSPLPPSPVAPSVPAPIPVAPGAAPVAPVRAPVPVAPVPVPLPVAKVPVAPAPVPLPVAPVPVPVPVPVAPVPVPYTLPVAPTAPSSMSKKGPTSPGVVGPTSPTGSMSPSYGSMA